MHLNFDVVVRDFAKLVEISGAWSTASFESLLEVLEYGDTDNLDDIDMREIALLALQDFEPVEAAEVMLKHYFGSRLSVGQIKNAANEMQDEKLWEEYADLSMHEGMFNVASILYAAFPRAFPKPEAIQMTLEVSATNDASREALVGNLTEVFIVRLLADGMEENSTLHRLFESQIKGNAFPEADKIIWISEVEPSDSSTIKIKITSSECWLAPIRGTKAYSSSARFDNND